MAETWALVGCPAGEAAAAFGSAAFGAVVAAAAGAAAFGAVVSAGLAVAAAGASTAREQGRPTREQQTDAISHNEKASTAGKRR